VKTVTEPDFTYDREDKSCIQNVSGESSGSTTTCKIEKETGG